MNFFKAIKIHCKVRDHCHYTGNILTSSTFSMCDISYKENSCISIIARNASAYDNHIILAEFAEKLKNCDFVCCRKPKS